MGTLTDLYDRPPPHSPHAEMVVLGAIMLEPKVLSEVRKRIKGPGDFYSPRHETIYAALLLCHDRDGDTLAMQLAARLAEAGKLEGCGGEGYLQELMLSSPSVAAALWAAQKVAEHARLRRVLTAADQIMHDVLYRGSAEEADDLCKRAVERIAEAARTDSTLSDTRLADAERAVLEQLESGEASTLTTGIGGFDRDLGGVPVQGLYCVFGYTSSGKTTLCLQIAEGLARLHGRWVRVFSYEQPAKRIAATMLAAGASIPVHERWNQGQALLDGERERLQAVLASHDALNFDIVEENMDAAAIFARCVEYREKHGMNGVVVVDYLQNLPPMAQDAVRSIDESMRWLQRTARDLGLLVFVVSQINREGGKSGVPPRITDALGGVAIESKSDVIAAVYRPYLMEPAPGSGADLAPWRAGQQETQIHLLKDKYGARGMAELRFNLPCLRFE